MAATTSCFHFRYAAYRNLSRSKSASDWLDAVAVAVVAATDFATMEADDEDEDTVPEVAGIVDLLVTEEEENKDETSKSLFRFLLMALGKIWQSPMEDRPSASACWFFSAHLSIVVAAADAAVAVDVKHFLLIDDAVCILDDEADKAMEDFEIFVEEDEAGTTVRTAEADFIPK